MPRPPDHPDLKAKSALWPQKNFVFCSVAVNIPLWSPCLPMQEHQLEASLYEQVAAGKACVAMNSPQTIFLCHHWLTRPCSQILSLGSGLANEEEGNGDTLHGSLCA